MDERDTEITLAVIATKLDGTRTDLAEIKTLLTSHVKDDRENFINIFQELGGTPESPGLRTRVTTLEKYAEIGKWLLGACGLAAIGEWASHLFSK